MVGLEITDVEGKVIGKVKPFLMITPAHDKMTRKRITVLENEEDLKKHTMWYNTLWQSMETYFIDEFGWRVKDFSKDKDTLTITFKKPMKKKMSSKTKELIKEYVTTLDFSKDNMDSIIRDMLRHNFILEDLSDFTKEDLEFVSDGKMFYLKAGKDKIFRV